MAMSNENTTEVGEQWTLGCWNEKFWKPGLLPFHLQHVHQSLEKFYDTTLGIDQKSRILVPLCGKTVDMIWLVKKGHEVVGVEYSKIAIGDFFKEHDLKFDKSETPDGNFVKYKAEDASITIYRGDFLDATPGVFGTFDGVWDRAAFTSMHPIGDNRIRYLQVMKTLLESNAVYLMSTLYHNVGHKGSPYSIDAAILQRVCGDMFDCKTFHEWDFMDKYISQEALKETVQQLIPK